MKNMKKFMALFVSSALCLSMMSVPVLAESETEAAEEGSNEVHWSDVEAAAEEMGLDGEFVTFDEIAVQLYIPSVMYPSELTDEDLETGYIGYYTTEDESSIVSIMYVDADGMELEEYQAYLEEEEGVSEVASGYINDLPVVTYYMEENDARCVSLATEMGYILEFAFLPASDEGYEAVSSVMIASIMPAEETGEEEAAEEEAAEEETMEETEE